MISILKKKNLAKRYKTLIIILVSVLISFWTLQSCTPKDEGYSEEDLENISKMQDLTDKIQKDLNTLNKDLQKKDPKKYDLFRKTVSAYDATLNKTAEEINKEDAGKEEYLEAAKTYQRVLDAYKNAGQNTREVQTKIDNLNTIANKIKN